MLADVDCDGNLVCYATGKQGVTLADDDRRHEPGRAGRRRHDAADERHLLHERRAPATRPATPARSSRRRTAARPGSPQTSGTTTALNAISCFQANACVAVGAVASGAAVVRFTTDGTNWNAGREHRHAGAERRRVPARRRVSRRRRGRHGHLAPPTAASTWTPKPTGTTNALNAVTCPSASACYAVGAAGTILKFPNVASGPYAADEQHDAARSTASRASNALDLLRRRRRRHRRRDGRRRHDVGAAGQPDQRPDDGASTRRTSR